MIDFKEKIAVATFGRSRRTSFAEQKCVACGGSATKFRDDISIREYHISFLCQECQDVAFCEPVEG